MANISPVVRQVVLIEAGYKCGNPVCRNVLTLEVHHIIPLKDGGPSTAENLLPLCGHCHDLHTYGHITSDAILTWKSLLVSLSNPTRGSVDVLLALYDEEERVARETAASLKGRGVAPPFRFTGDGLGILAPLMTSGLVTIPRRFSGASGWGGGMPSFEVRLTERGRQLVAAWRSGNGDEIRRVLESPRADPPPASMPDRQGSADE